MSAAARVVESFPYDVEVIDHVGVTTSDGAVLSMKLWMPVQKQRGQRFGAVLEAIPYRKDDICLQDDSVRMAYVAGHGFICARLDLRGSGDSHGVLDDEYSGREQLDICEVIAWLAAHPCCNGNVGMTGISWSGFNSLQVAARRPPALKAIVTVCSTDDRYDNDVHYMGGTPLAFYMNWWGAIVHEFNMRPPEPSIVGEDWEWIWRERLAENAHLQDKWLAHQRRDAYWRIGSVCEDYSAIACPVLAVGGWADAYTDAIVRLLDNIDGCVKAIIGPWGHTWPERPVPGPAIGFLQETVRWWDYWLNGVDNGVDADPNVRYYLQDAFTPSPSLDHVPGTWMQARSLSKRNSQATLWLHAGGTLAEAPAASGDDAGTVSHCSSLLCGTQVDTWLPMGSPIDLPAEQSPDDERSLCFEGAELAEDLCIVGTPVVHLRIAADKPRAFVFARLCDIAPDGSSRLITRGALNLTHRDSHEQPEELEPETFYDVDVALKVIAQRVPAGHRLRLALSTSYWTWLWPSPELATIRVSCAASSLTLPLANGQDAPLRRSFEPPEIAAGQRPSIVPGDGFTAERSFDAATGTMSYTRHTNDCAAFTTPAGTTVSGDKVATYRIVKGDPLSAHMDTRRFEVFERDGWRVELDVRSSMDCDAENFIVRTQSRAVHNGTTVLDETHCARIPRDCN